MSYPIGMICIGQNFEIAIFRNGMECEVIEELSVKEWRAQSGELGSSECYTVKWVDGSIGRQEPVYLRPKHEPGSWTDEEFIETLDLLGWNPRIEA